MAKETPSNLPAYTTIENVFKLLDALKRKNGNEADAKIMFGMGSTAYTNTKSVLRTFRLIEEDSCNLTQIGRNIAYASDEKNKKIELEKIMLGFNPYESLLNNIFQKDKPELTAIDDITNFWGIFKQGSTERNIKEAATLFMSIMDYLEFGEVIKGRGSNPTRIKWGTNSKQRFEKAVIQPGESEHFTDTQTNPVDSELEPQPPAKFQADGGEVPSDNNISASPQKRAKASHYNSINNITISVDMSAWPDEKIKSFFKYVHGIFEEEEQSDDK